MAEHNVILSNGAKIYAKLLGNGDQSKPLLIVLHGAPGLPTHVEPETSFGFLQSRFRVLIYDARGSGVSDKKKPYTNARWAQDVDN
jgi:proline iminopeptidase